MSTISATGSTLEDALTTAIAELVSCDAEKVTLRLEAPGLQDVSGRLRFDVEVTGAAAEPDRPSGEPYGSSDEPDDDVPAATGGPDAVEGEGAPVDDDKVVSAEELDEEADAAADFLEGLLDALDLPGDLRIKVHPDHAELEVIDIGSGALIGRRGQTLEAIQELVRCTLQRQFQRRARVKIDAEGYRSRRLEKLVEKAEEAIDAVLDTGEPERLEPMDVFERKAIHQLVAEVEGLESRSQGREPARRVVIERA